MENRWSSMAIYLFAFGCILYGNLFLSKQRNDLN